MQLRGLARTAGVNCFWYIVDVGAVETVVLYGLMLWKWWRKFFTEQY